MDSSVNNEPLSPVRFLARSAEVYPARTAVVHGEQRFTYRELQTRVFRLAHALRDAGIQPGDRVAALLPNVPAMLEAHFAVPMLGAALVAINTRLSAGEVGYILNHSGAKLALVDNELASIIEGCRGELKTVERFVNVCDIDDSRPLDGPDYESFIAAAADTPLPVAIDDENAPLSINYTSGTTGRPKGVLYHHRGAYLNALGECLESGLSHGAVYLWTLPMFHCNGWCFPWAVTAMGGTHVCLRKVEPERVYELVDAEQVTHLCAAPTVLISLASLAEERGIKLERPLRIVTAGAPPAAAVIANMEATGAEITHVYGLTEVFGPHSVCAFQNEWTALSPEERATMKSRQGVPYIIAHHMDVVDSESMEPVPRDGKTVGEIVMRGNNVMRGYYNDPEATEAAFRGGWFHSGDLAVVHPDNYVQILDRKKDIIISGGENISTVEVEGVLYKHPAVLEVAVVPAPHDKWGEVPKAFVTLRPGHAPEPEEIIEFCKQHLARFKAPKAVEFGELPKTATGKIQKFKLREREWEGRDKRVN